jgi:hypothetical protein
MSNYAFGEWIERLIARPVFLLIATGQSLRVDPEPLLSEAERTPAAFAQDDLIWDRYEAERPTP